jgi:hypothetical protein
MHNQSWLKNLKSTYMILKQNIIPTHRVSFESVVARTSRKYNMIAPSPTKNLETVLVKAPHRKEVYTEDELIEFAKCADPVTGPLYFMDNFFFIQHPTRGKMLYHPFDYQND